MSEFMNKKYNLLFVLTIFITGIIAYSNSFDCSFHFDDGNVFHSSVTEGSATISDWIRLFPNRPLGILTFVLDFHLHGLDVWGYHLVNLIIHLTNAFLVWWLTWLTLSTPAMRDTEISRHKTLVAFLTGMLFVTHPLATQSVTYIVQRFASLATLFYLLSLILFVQGKIWQGNKNITWFLFGGSIACAVLGMLTKEIVFTLPFAILLYDCCFFKTIPWKLEIKDKGLIISCTIFLIFILWSVRVISLRLFDPILPIQGYAYSISMKEYFFTQFSVILTYIRLFILPINQNFDYDYPLSTSFFQLKTFFSFSLLLGILAAGVGLFKRYRLISFGIFWFFLTLSVESSIIPISQNVIFEHRAYLPGFGFFLALVGAFFYFIKERYFKIAVIILLMIAAINTVLTYQRNKVWKNEHTFWADCLKKSPDKARVNNNFGLVMFAEGKTMKAIEYYNKAIRITPDFIFFYNNRGAAYAKLGQYQRAIDDYNQAIRLKPDHPGAYYNKGVAYSDLGQYQQTIENFNKAIYLRPGYAEAYNNRGNTYGKFGQYQREIEDYNQAIRLKPNFADAYFNRGIAYGKLGQHQREIEDYNQALRLKPDDADAYFNRGTAYGLLGQYQNAIENFDQAIRLKPDSADSYNNRGYVYLMQGKEKLGCPDAQRACELGKCKTLEWARSKMNCRAIEKQSQRVK